MTEGGGGIFDQIGSWFKKSDQPKVSLDQRRGFLRGAMVGTVALGLEACAPAQAITQEAMRANLNELLDPEAVVRYDDLRMMSPDLRAAQSLPSDLTGEMLQNSLIRVFELSDQQALAANLSPQERLVPMLQLQDGPHAGSFVPLGVFKEELMAGPLSKDIQTAQLKNNQAMRWLVFSDQSNGVNLPATALKGGFKAYAPDGKQIMIEPNSGATLRIVESRPDILNPVNNGKAVAEIKLPSGETIYAQISMGVVPDKDPATGKPLHYALRHGQELGPNFPDVLQQNINGIKAFQEVATQKKGQTVKPLMMIESTGNTTIIAEVKMNGQTTGVAALVEKTNGSNSWYHGFEMNATQSKSLGASTPRAWDQAMILARQYAQAGNDSGTLQNIHYLDANGVKQTMNHAAFSSISDADIYKGWRQAGTKIPKQLPAVLGKLSSMVNGLNMVAPMLELTPLAEGNDLASTLEATLANLAPDWLTFRDGNRGELNLDQLAAFRGGDFGRVLVNDGGMVAVRTDMDPVCPIAFAAVDYGYNRRGAVVKALNTASSVKQYATGEVALPLTSPDRTPIQNFADEQIQIQPWHASDGYTMSQEDYRQRIESFLYRGEVQPFPINEVYNRYSDANGVIVEARYLVAAVHFQDGSNKLFIYNQRDARQVA